MDEIVRVSAGSITERIFVNGKIKDGGPNGNESGTLAEFLDFLTTGGPVRGLRVEVIQSGD